MIVGFGVFVGEALCATDAHACGQYEVTGFVRGGNYDYRIVVAEGTISQTTFTPVFRSQHRLFPYNDAFVKARVSVSTAFDGTRVSVATIDSIELAAADPLMMAESSRFKQVRKADCR